jgi:hypothetical protein
MAEQLGGNPPDGTVAPGLHQEVTASGGATRTLKASDSGGVFLWDAATGVSYTLPVPAAGMRFTFVATVSVTSNAHAIATDAATTFIGGAIQQVIDTSGTSEGQVGDATSDVTISMNGSTTGGLIGTQIDVVALSATTWSATGLVVSSGTLSTPYA